MIRGSTTFCRTVFCILSAFAPTISYAQSCAVDFDRVQEAIHQLEQKYDYLLSDISCDAPTVPAHEILCDSSYEDRPLLWRMARLNDLAWVKAYEKTTKRKADLNDPPRDVAFIARRDACTDAACLCDVMIEHGNASLGRESPYTQD
jgi:hypothetical protein